MRSSGLLRNILLIVFTTLMLLVLLVTLTFSIVSNSIYSQMKADELEPRAEFIADQISDYEAGKITREALERSLRMDESVMDATIIVLGYNGTGITNDAHDPGFQEKLDYTKKYLSRVLTGEKITITSTKIGVLVGAPAYYNGNPICAVFLVKDNAEVRVAVKNLIVELAISMCALAFLMTIPVYIFSRKLTRPMVKVSEAALTMANGDFHVRASVEGNSEFRRLSTSFNILADTLQKNINDLVIERNRLFTILNGIGEGIISVDRDGVITHFNQASVKLLGGAQMQTPAALPIYAQIAPNLFKVLDNAEQMTVDIDQGETIIRCTTTPLYEESGSLCGAVMLISNITESERLEQTRRDYVANVSHELRTPLTSIRSLAEALNDDLITDAGDKKRYYGYILKESIRLSHLIDDLLELSRLQSGGVAFTKRKVELYEIIMDVSYRMSDSAFEHGMRIDVLSPEAEYYAHSNPDRIEQVVVALVGNAIIHGADGGEISVNISDEADEYVISVSNPAQIDERDVKHLFERFYKADHSHSKEGTGLGLAIANEVLELLGERIWVDYHDGIICFSFTVSKESVESKNTLIPAGQ